MARIARVAIGLFGLIVTFFVASAANAAVIVLQPGPDNSKDIWTTSVYSYGPFGGGPGGGLADSTLRVGGWGDLYYSLLQFNLAGLPSSASSVRLQLNDSSSNSGTPTGIYLNQITSHWDWKTMGTGSDHLRLWWADQPSTTLVPTSPTLLPAPTVGSSYSIDITNLYNAWQSGSTPNYGIELRPAGNNNNFDFFDSSRATDPSLRPALIIQPAPTSSQAAPNFSFPLQGAQVFLETIPGGLSADATIGKYCDIQTVTANFDPCHQPNKAYYAVDFVLQGGTNDTANVVAAASGKVVKIEALSFTDKNGTYYYPKVVVQNDLPDSSGIAVYTIYQEFGKFYVSDYGSVDAAKAAAINSVDVGLGHVDEGTTVIGTLTAGNGHLHFQVGYGCSATNDYTDCSTEYTNGNTLSPLSNYEINGRKITGYVLDRTCDITPSGNTYAVDCHGHPPDPTLIGSPLLPTMPSSTNNGVSLFNLAPGNLGLGLTQPIYIDPPTAIGYDFSIIAGPLFRSVILPTEGDGQFDLWLWDPSSDQFVFDTLLTSGVPFDFGPSGVAEFRITGIEPDPNNPDFIPGLTFTDSGAVTFTETPILGVPEPSTLSIFAFAVAGLFVPRIRKAFRVSPVRVEVDPIGGTILRGFLVGSSAVPFS